MPAIVENPTKEELKNSKTPEVIGGEFEIEVGDGIDAQGTTVEVKEEPTVEEPVVEEPAVEEPVEIGQSSEELAETKDGDNGPPASVEAQTEGNKVENMEACAAVIIEFQGKECVVFNKSIMVHDMNQDAKEKLHATITNAFIDKTDVERIHTIAQECSLNGIDPFSSPLALKEMFDRAVAEGVMEIEEAPDLTKNIIIGDKVYFKNGQIADLDENAITLDVGQIERILEAENPEQMKEMLEEIEKSRPMDGPVQDGPIQSGPVNEGPVSPSSGMER